MRIMACGIATLIALVGLYGAGCAPSSPNDLDKLGMVRLKIKDQTFELWVADDAAEQARGLMFITAEQMAPLADGTERGMLFVFDRERPLNFWMKNTIIPLDIAYVDATGTIVSIHTMAALDDRIGQYPSGRSARFAIEVNANLLSRLGAKAGDQIEIPN